MARPCPVLPEVGSMMVPPGRSLPVRSASSTMVRPIRSLTLPPGFSCSSLARMVGLSPAVTLCRRTRGVCPTRSRMLSLYLNYRTPRRDSIPWSERCSPPNQRKKMVSAATAIVTLPKIIRTAPAMVWSITTVNPSISRGDDLRRHRLRQRADSGNPHDPRHHARRQAEQHQRWRDEAEQHVLEHVDAVEVVVADGVDRRLERDPDRHQSGEHV